MLGDKKAAARTYADLTGPMTPLEMTAALYRGPGKSLNLAGERGLRPARPGIERPLNG